MKPRQVSTADDGPLISIETLWNGSRRYSRFVRGKGFTDIIASSTPLTAEQVEAFRVDPKKFKEEAETVPTPTTRGPKPEPEAA